ncbi:MAG: hypothetical protein PHQ58_08530 [Rhodoferax sp.]|uniref:hypothetical protein n=1 Tax=Rhodoferax sp. TaxID=50421 RepID=UPI002639EF8A|nr:hypothetical protein [Rhodoferax sp.]MDD2880470.1 hypothetical protein [Rhodoferax sp.]
MKKSLLALILVSAFSASNAATVHTTSASFLSALNPGYYTENFNTTIGGGTPASGTVFSSGAFSYNMTASVSTLYSGSNLFGVFNNTSSLTINFLGGNVNAVGANFFETNVSDVFLNSSVSISLSDGTALTFTPTSVSDYRGFIADSGVFLTSLTMAAGGTGQWESLDNLTVGNVARNDVPEPASIASHCLVSGS